VEVDKIFNHHRTPFHTHLIIKVTDMLVHCTENFRSIDLISFLNETFAKQQEAMQLEFRQSYTIKGIQNFHYFHPTQMKRMGPI